MTRFVVRHFDVGRVTAGKDAELARRSPVLAVLATDRDRAGSGCVQGRLSSACFLTATAAGLQASYLNQPMQVDALRPRVAELLARPGVAQVGLRLGYPPRDVPATPRRAVEDVVEWS